MNTDTARYASLNKGPIIVIDDSEGESELLRIAFSELGVENKILFFNDGLAFLKYIKSEKGGTFFILCDVNMPKISGLELKKNIQDDEELRLKCIPFILYSTSSANASILKAYSYGVQGYLLKPHDNELLHFMLQATINYWSVSERPH